MSIPDLVAVLTALSAIISAAALFFTVVPIHRKVKKIVEEVQTGNGASLGEQIDKVANLADAIEDRRIDLLPPDDYAGG